jgi:PAS domain S-box-containing protein
MLDDPATLPWRAHMEPIRLRASAVFPIRQNGKVCGALSVYVSRRDFFHDKEIALLEEAATNISFALDNFAREESRRKAEQMLRDEKSFSDTMIESMPGIVYFYDFNGKFLRWNENFQNISGFSPAEIAKALPSDFVAVQDRVRLSQKIADVFETGQASLEASFVSKEGTRTPYLFTWRRISLKGVPCLVGVGIDLTERKQMEAERERRLKAEAADHIKSAFLATMSHELRTPLNSVIGFTGILLQGLAGPFNPEQEKQLNMVRGSARHLLALVNDVLDVSKIEAGQLDVLRKSFDLSHSINKVMTLVAPQAEAKGLKLTIDIAAPLGQAVSDERRFEQILINLVGNAIKFTDEGQITVRANRVANQRFVNASLAVAAVRVQVSDTGIGIRAQDLATLFEPFRQINTGLSRPHAGTGLGLAICRRLAALMGGEIHAESQWGHCSTFTVTLPLNGGD